MSDIRILSASDVARALPMAQAVEGMKEAYAHLSAGQAHFPLRTKVEVPAYDGTALIMPAYLPKSDDLTVKIVTVYPRNPTQSKPVIYATVLILDAESGRLLAILEGAALTAIRTGAASGAATDLLARPDARKLAILGSGVQARTQLEAVCTVRPISSVSVYSPDQDHARAFAEEMAGRHPIPESIRVVSEPQEAVTGADVICTATTSATPVFDGRHLSPGAHVNAIGSFRPDMQEVDLETIRRAKVVVDSREAAMEEAGDLLVPLRLGAIDEGHIYAELGEIAAGNVAGRSSDQEITYFKSVGVAVQDAVAARIALRNAIAQGLGASAHL